MKLAGSWPVLALSLLVPTHLVAQTLPLTPTRTIAFTTDEGTLLSLDVSPDGRTIVFDLLGDLYSLPITGGKATVLTRGIAYDKTPRFSPDGKQIVFVSDRSGTQNLWVMDADGARPRPVTRDTTSYFRSPRWTPDGRALITRKDTAVYANTNPGPRQRTTPTTRYDVTSGTEGELSAAEVSAVEEQEKHVRSLVPDSELASSAVRTPDSQAVVFAAEGKIWRLTLASRAVTNIPFTADVRAELGPLMRVKRRLDDGPLLAQQLRSISPSPDGQELTFAALGHIWLTKRGGAPRRLTASAEREYDPVFSPDGRWIAFISWSDTTGSQLWKAPVAGGPAVRLAAGSAIYMTPRWSPDGSRLVFFAESLAATPRQTMYQALQLDRANRSRIHWVAASGGPAHVVPNVQVLVAAQFGLPSLAVSGDGSRIYYLHDSLTSRNGMGRDGLHSMLKSVEFDGSEARVHARLHGFGLRAAPSPDGRWLAVQSTHDIFVAPFPSARGSTPGGDSIPDLTFTWPGPDSGIVRVTREGGMAPSWSSDSRELRWNWTNHLRWGPLDKLLQTSEAPGTLRPQEIAIELRVPRPFPAGKVLLRGARLVTMAARGVQPTRTATGATEVGTDPVVIERGDLLLDRNRIAALGPTGSFAVPADAAVIDVTGKTIIPGLIDAHAHPHRNHYVLPEQHPTYAAALAHGVTTTFGPAYGYTLHVYAELIEAGGLLGPRTYGALNLIPPYGENSNREDQLTSLGAAEHVARKHRSAGALALKHYLYPHRFQRQWLIMAAARVGVPVITCNTFGVEEVIKYVLDGYTGWEHGLVDKVYKDVIELLGRAGTYWGQNERTVHPVASADAPKLRRFWPYDFQVAAPTPAQPPAKAVATSSAKWISPRMLRAGGTVTAGTHGYMDMPGLMVHYSLESYVAIGMTPAEALRLTTLNSARALGLEEDLGSIEVGKVADLLVLNSNPLEDIRHSADIQYIIQNGRFLRGEDLATTRPTVAAGPGKLVPGDTR